MCNICASGCLGSTVGTPNGWPRGNDTNSRGLITSIYCRLCLSRYWTVLHKNPKTRTHTRARAPTRPREHQKKLRAQGTQLRSRSSDLAILQRWQTRGSLLGSTSALALPLTTALTAARQARTTCGTFCHDNNRLKLPRWYDAAKDIALIQPPSAFMERVFSIMCACMDERQEESSSSDRITASAILKYNRGWGK